MRSLLWVLVVSCVACETQVSRDPVALVGGPPVPAFRTRGPFYGKYNGAYLWNHTACTEQSSFVYYEPAAPGPFPIAVYVPGTTTFPDDPLPHSYLRMLAERGYLAAAVDYGQDHWNCAFGCYCYKSKADCVFDAAKPMSLIAVLDRDTDADSSLGIVTWGHSQGGYIAAMAGDRNPNVVRAAATGTANPDGLYSSCMLPATRGLESDRLRFVIGEHDEVTPPSQPDDKPDGTPGIRRQLAELIERPDCSGPGISSCFDDDGSGFYIVSGGEVEDGTATHQFFVDSRYSGSDFQTLDAYYVGDPSAPWSLESTVDWVTGAVPVD